MLKKSNTVLIVLLSTLLVLSGCGGSSSKSSEKEPQTNLPAQPDTDTSDPTDTDNSDQSDNSDTGDTDTTPPVGVEITIDGMQIKHTIHPMIQGQGLIYSHEADHIYADGSMAQLYKDVGAGFLRYPGGTVTTMYHWNDLNGQGWTDSWNPNYNRDNDALPENYMDLDEYMALCRASNCEPMLGINMSSGRNYDRDEDGLNEAIALLKYCKEKNFELNYLYLDNENHHKKWSAEEYANLINYYVPALREHAPNAKLIANWTRSFRSNRGSFKTLLDIAGNNFDYIDVHYYWKWGVASWELWKETTPMVNKTEWYDGSSYIEEIAYFKSMMSELGKPHIKLASMEWNIGPGPHSEDPQHTPFKTALMQSEMQMQFMLSGLEIGAMWSTQWPDGGDGQFRFLVDSGDNYRPTPSAKVFELYKHALNGELVQSETAHEQIMVTTVIQDDEAFVYLLNKSDSSEDIYINLNGYNILSADQAVSFQHPGVFEYNDVSQNNEYIQANLSADTLTMIKLVIEQQ
ncbi:hypothetical protein RI845_03185 [Thalassotalea nanhaiensis]|uniref:Alpha-L-arabinofuranosidase 1 catalytic domain-containing protein n=1 Tax=Thalassotalea nanhaiensis TaxID=3065648 RepID=A0ABY9TN80_9GAMM|nr:hypothetical protein RI845_03185 [Colwelliaceae bacterium SQ345]